MSHVTYESVMSHMNKSCHISTSRATDDSAAPAGEDNIMVEFPIGNAAERKAAAAKAGLACMESDEEVALAGQ